MSELRADDPEAEGLPDGRVVRKIYRLRCPCCGNWRDPVCFHGRLKVDSDNRPLRPLVSTGLPHLLGGSWQTIGSRGRNAGEMEWTRVPMHPEDIARLDRALHRALGQLQALAGGGRR